MSDEHEPRYVPDRPLTPENRLWSTLVRVVGEPRDDVVDLAIPAWRASEHVPYSTSEFPPSLQERLEDRYRFHAQCNIGAERREDLHLCDFELSDPLYVPGKPHTPEYELQRTVVTFLDFLPEEGKFLGVIGAARGNEELTLSMEGMPIDFVGQLKRDYSFFALCNLDAPRGEAPYLCDFEIPSPEVVDETRKTLEQMAIKHPSP